MDRNPEFLKKKYPSFHTDPEVDKVAERLKRGADHFIDPIRNALQPQINRMLQDPSIRIQNYLNDLKESLDAKNPRRGEKLQRIKQILHDNFVIKPKDFSEGFFTLQQRIAREQGHGNIEITPEMREDLMEPVIADQISSLDAWIDYLSSPDALYPDWLKYWAMRSVLGMGAYDKEKKEFDRRRTDTVKPFPDINREAIAMVLDMVNKKYSKEYIDLDNLEQKDQEKLSKLLQGENFAKLYAFAIEKFTPATVEQLTITAGRWVKYPHGSDHMPLVKSLQTHSTGWCTAGEGVAREQLDQGDFYVYYSMDEKDMPRIPRVAIRMQNNQIQEVRGIAEQQNLDPYIGDVVDKKLKDFSDGELYKQKSSDMKYLTFIDAKVQNHQQLTREDLVFLCEIDRPIQGFGYEKDPRVKEILATRTDVVFDQCLIFNCLPQDIAHSEHNITSQTKVFIGKLSPGIFKKLWHVDHIYSSFPEGRIRKEELLVGGKTKDQLIAEMKNEKIIISSYAQQMMDNKDFVTSKHPEQMQFVRLSIRDLFGDENTQTIADVLNRAEKLGLELCPAETGPTFRLQYKKQPLNEWIQIGMKQISDADGSPRVFDVAHNGDGFWLNYHWAKPGHRWGPDNVFMFRLRKSEN